MNERTTGAATTVEEDGIRVEKSFTDDEFPVPAVRYDLSSSREEAARVRIVDTIPETFPMDRVGFHPEYESDNWTAYKDHRVEFERVLEPGEKVETVFGIRADDPDLDGFMATPVIEHVPVGEEIEDVLGTGETDAVREVLSGDRATLPGMDEPAEPDATKTTEETEAAEDVEPAERTPTPRPTDDETTAAVTRRSDADEPAESDLTQADDEGTEAGTAGSDEEDDVDPTPTRQAESVSAALAAEIRNGTVAEEDLSVLRSELDLNLPRSVDVRISRLQSSVADIEAYADALAEFIDDEGTAREVLDGLQSRVDAVESDLAAVDDSVEDVDERIGTVEGRTSAVESGIEGIEDDVEAVTADVSTVQADLADVDERIDDIGGDVSAVTDGLETVETSVTEVTEDVAAVEEDLTGLGETMDDVGDDIETLYEGVDDVDAAVSRTDERVDDVEGRLDRFDAEFDDVWDDMAEVDGRLTDVEDRLGDDVADVEAEIGEIRDHLEELEAFRKRLNEAFGPGPE